MEMPMKKMCNPFRVGEHDKWKNEGSEVDIKVEKVIRHPDFDRHTYNNDIALFKLEHPIKFNKYVSPACLPKNDVPPGTNCYVTGWDTLSVKKVGLRISRTFYQSH